jgi:MoaA/NifB/PqqE/SkfB family radical SAM enzyme
VGWERLRAFIALPDDFSGYRLTWKRLANLYLNRWEGIRRRPVLRSLPTRIVVEPTNTCNLRCPYCHTGAGRFGRRPAMLDLARARALLDEIGDSLLLVELFNWGESLLHPELPELVADASRRGLSTRVNTNFSMPFSDAQAERLVASGLTDLFVSIDGATQPVYERYRVGGDLTRVLDNCRRVAAAKRRLGATSPQLTLQYLRFPCNEQEGDAIRRVAAETGMRLLAFRGATPDPAWDAAPAWPPWFLEHRPGPCPYLFGHPVFTVDGNVAPCRGVFQRFDDFAHVAAGPGDAGARSFREAWNADRFQTARRLFHGREDASAEARRLPCWECPTTLFHERWRAHRAAGGSIEDFAPGMSPSAHGPWNYFWERGQGTEAPVGAPVPRRPRSQ